MNTGPRKFPFFPGGCLNDGTFDDDIRLLALYQVEKFFS